ncbi:branched-chain amino acid aminotransferase [Mesobacillus zeae]|uniref:Branched-chain amino acid aminotransferase n=2 Tax=Mesobacillus zeae TaxID=1917180 RepID=A0A398B701_9BACI|nr:branched-chain amino acid aminotransferase [Mesobacillus zeae]
MERGDKETEQMLAVENNDFLAQRIDYFKKNKLEFLYMESEWFDLVGADSVSFESDDVFGKYDVMLGLKLQKKLGAAIKAFLDQSLQHGAASYDLLFSGNEGLWTLNFSLDDAAGFREDMMIEEAFELIYQVLFKLAETVENQQKNNH